MTAQISQGLEEIQTERGTEYSVEYYCATDNDVLSVKQNVYDVANWTGAAYARVSTVSKKSVGISGPPYIIRMTSVPADAYNTNDPRNKSDLGSQKIEKLSVSEIYIEPDWFSLKKATSEDVGKKNLNSEACVVGDYIYKNATTSSVGSPDSKSNILTGSVSSSANLLNVIDKVFKKQNYEVTVNTKTSMSSLSNNVDDVPGNTTPPGNGWRVADKQATTVFDVNGDSWNQLNVKWEKVPDELRNIGFTAWK